MTNFDIRKLAISSVGALALSATCILAAVGPAHAANAPLTTADWQRVVADRVSSGTDMIAAGMLRSNKAVEAGVAIDFNAEGDFAGASIVRSSGSAATDRHALAVARETKYPPLPAGFRGRPQTVIVRLAFGSATAVADHFARTGGVSVELASAARPGGTRIAVK